MGNKQKKRTKKWVSDRCRPAFVVYGDFGHYRATRRTAALIVAQLNRCFRPRWISFKDQFDALIRVRTRDIQGLYDSKQIFRARHRAFDHKLEQKESVAPDWGSIPDWDNTPEWGDTPDWIDKS